MAITKPAKRKQVDEFAAAAAREPRTALKLRGRKAPLALTLPPDLIAAVDAIAAQEERSRAKMMELLLRSAIEHRRTAA